MSAGSLFRPDISQYFMRFHEIFTHFSPSQLFKQGKIRLDVRHPVHSPAAQNNSVCAAKRRQALTVLCENRHACIRHALRERIDGIVQEYRDKNPCLLEQGNQFYAFRQLMHLDVQRRAACRVSWRIGEFRIAGRPLAGG